jgi:hypothetical protein
MSEEMIVVLVIAPFVVALVGLSIWFWRTAGGDGAR